MFIIQLWEERHVSNDDVCVFCGTAEECGRPFIIIGIGQKQTFVVWTNRGTNTHKRRKARENSGKLTGVFCWHRKRRVNGVFPSLSHFLISHSLLFMFPLLIAFQLDMRQSLINIWRSDRSQTRRFVGDKANKKGFFLHGTQPRRKISGRGNILNDLSVCFRRSLFILAAIR